MKTSSHPYAELSPITVLEAVESLGYETDARMFPLNSYENRVYQVGINGKPSIIVKFYRPERWSTEQILEEHRYTQELVDLEIQSCLRLILLRVVHFSNLIIFASRYSSSF